jgi:hypothetical protein
LGGLLRYSSSIFSRNELVDFNRALALDSDCFQLFGIKLKILALADLVALDDVASFHFIAGVSIHLAILDPMSGVLIELVETYFLSLTGRR